MRLVHKQRQHGFTLIELMVVVVIISVMLTLVVWNIGDAGRGQQMEEEARRLTALIKLARDEAVLMSQPMALVIEDEQYSFQRLGDKGFTMIEDDRVLRQRALEPGLIFELEMGSYKFMPRRSQGQQASPGLTTTTDDQPAEEDDSEEDEELPRLYIFPSGEVRPPLTLYVKEQDDLDSERYRISVDQQGEVTWEGPLTAEQF